MMRFLILSGFTFLIFQLHISGNINKYINTKYSYLSFGGMLLLAVLSLVQLYNFINEGDKKESGCGCPGNCFLHPQEHEHDHHHAHEHNHIQENQGHGPRHLHYEHHQENHHHSHEDHRHSHEERTWLQKITVYGVFLFPLITGLFLPIKTLDSSFVKAKGFHFNGFETSKDDWGQHQFLRPDTSIFYGSDGYKKVAERDLKTINAHDEVKLNDDNYLKGMETIYNFPGTFIGRTIQFDGFIFHGDKTQPNQLFVFRFGIIHCIADSGVFGMLVQFPDGTQFKDDQWVRVTGTLSSLYYQPFKETIPILNVEKWTKIAAPKDPYAYRTD